MLMRFSGLFRRFRPPLVFSLLWLALSGCESSDRSRPAPVLDVPSTIPLGVVGYNYTDRSISDFSVNGQGGGNIGVSSPGSGGGGTVCCVPYVAAPDPWTVTVRWQSGACYYRARSTISDEVFDLVHWFFKKQTVVVETPKVANPRYLEVHFYPDGSVKAAVTEHAGDPRLKLSPERENPKPYPRCPDDKKPAN